MYKPGSMRVHHRIPLRVSHMVFARRSCSLGSAELENLTRLASLMSPEALRGQQRHADLSARISSRTVSVLQGDRSTPGALIPVDYLSGTNAVTHWEPFFRKVYAAHAEAAQPRPTAPLYQCPFCLSKARRASSSTPARPNRSADGAEPSAWTWRTPVDMRSHMSWCHAGEGISPAELRDHNAHVVAQLASRQTGTTTHDDSTHTSDSQQQEQARKRLPFRAIVLIDTANIELGCPDTFLDLTRNLMAAPDPAVAETGGKQRTRPATANKTSVLSSFPIAFGCVQELFIPHTAKVPHAVFQLAQGHDDSDFFTFYAVNRLEAGDLTTASLIAALHDVMRVDNGDPTSQSRCPPIVVLTMDAQQKQCLTQLYGEGISALGVGDCPVLCPRFLNEASILNALRDAIDSTLEA